MWETDGREVGGGQARNKGERTTEDTERGRVGGGDGAHLPSPVHLGRPLSGSPPSPPLPAPTPTSTPLSPPLSPPLSALPLLACSSMASSAGVGLVPETSDWMMSLEILFTRPDKLVYRSEKGGTDDASNGFTNDETLPDSREERREEGRREGGQSKLVRRAE